MFMWLAGRQQPDFRTINRFRSDRMKEVLETVFTHVLELLVQEQYVSLEHYFLDGTKLEANENRYTFVWKKAFVKYQAKLQEKVVQQLEGSLQENPKNIVKKAVRQLRKDLLPRLQKYED